MRPLKAVTISTIPETALRSPNLFSSQKEDLEGRRGALQHAGRRSQKAALVANPTETRIITLRDYF